MSGKQTFIAAIFLCLLASLAHAQSAAGPQFLMTWSAANSYAPDAYPGKVLPNTESQITVALELVSAGKPVDLSNQTIYWYLDDNLLGGGIGTQRITFQPYDYAPSTPTIKVELPDYPGGLLIDEISIPVVQPSVVIDALYPSGIFSTSEPSVQAMPYFFATTSTSPLSFTWSVNGQAVSGSENPQSLQISLPQGTPTGFAISISLNVQNANDSTMATAATSLTYQPQP